MKITNKQRIFSILLSVFLLVSALNIVIPTIAEGTAVITGAKAYLWPNMSVSDLKDVVKAESNDLKGSVVETTVWKDGALTDVVSNYGSDMETGWFNFALNDDYTLQRKSGSSVDDVSNDVDQTDNYWRLRFKINGTLNNPQSFVLNFHKSTKTLASQHYAVFAADSIDKLESSKIIEMKASKERCGDFFDVSGLNLTNIKYVEVRIYHRGFNQQNWGSKPIIMGQHINEIGFFGGTVNSNEGTAITEHTVISKNPSLTLGENHLVGSDMKAGFYSADKLVADCKLDSNTAANFTDGVLSNDYNLNWDVGKKYTAGYPNDAFQTDSYYQIQIELSGRLKSPDRFILIGREDGQFMSHHYAVFASDNLNELYKASNKIIEISDSQERAGDDVSLTGFDKTVNYVGIRFYHRGYTFDAEKGNTLQFINEIGLYGGELIKDTFVNTEHTIFTKSTQVNLLAENHLTDKTGSAAFYANNTKTGEHSGFSSASFDGKLSGGAVLGAWHKSGTCYTSGASNDIRQTDNYWQVEISLGGTLNNPDKFIMAFHNKELTLMSKHYAVFVSSNLNDLYESNSKIIEIRDETPRLADEVDLTKIGAELTGIRYIGIRFYHRGFTNGFGCSMQHVDEIGVYGGEFSEDKVDVKLYSTKGQYSDEQLRNDIAAIGKNLIAGQVPYQRKVNGLVVSDNGDYKMLTDGAFNKHANLGVYTGQRDGQFDMIYRLDSNPDAIKQIKKFVMRAISSDGQDARQWDTGKYEVYASVSITTLFNSEHMIYSYDYERDGKYPCQTAAFKETIYARYVAVRIIDPITDSNNLGYTYPRISEIAVLGTDADVPDEETELSKHMPVDVYVTDNAGKRTQITNQITPEMLNRLTDNDSSTDIDFTVNGDTLDIVYNLCKDYDLTKVTVNRAGSFKYTVYAAQSLSELWSENARLSSGDFTGKTKARYVRISVDKGQGKKLTFKDISVIGLTNPLIERYEHISYSFGTNNLKVFEKPVNDNNIVSIKYVSSAYNNLFDSSTGAESLVAGGVKGKSTLNMLVYLSQLQSIENVSVYFAPHLLRYLPTKTRIYVSDSYEGIMDFTKAPAIEFNGLPESGKFQLSTIPTLARYVRIEFVSNIYGDNIKDINGEKLDDPFVTENMNIAVTEIDIEGVTVMGTGTEDGVLTSFSDGKSGISWDVKSLDSGDIVDDFCTSKLTVIKATNAQKASLYKSPYYKVIGNSAYSIEFYDFSGNKVTDIKNREITIKIPVTEEKLNGLSMIADATDQSKLELCKTDDSKGETNYVTYTANYDSGFKFSLVELTDENDAYWQTVDLTKPDNTPSGDNTNSNNGSNSSNTPADNKGNTGTNNGNAGTTASDSSQTVSSDTESTEPETIKVDAGTETKYKVSYSSAPVWLIVVTVIQGVLLLAAAAMWFIIQFYKGKKKKILSV